jgi:hypothetical protein
MQSIYMCLARAFRSELTTASKAVSGRFGHSGISKEARPRMDFSGLQIVSSPRQDVRRSHESKEVLDVRR